MNAGQALLVGLYAGCFLASLLYEWATRRRRDRYGTCDARPYDRRQTADGRRTAPRGGR